MATYKVLQDIEAEDKFLGPLTLKQCIFGAVAIVSGYLGVVFIMRGVWLLSMPLVPVVIVTGFLAFPWGRDQPTEVWLLAKIKFMFKPRKRIWDQAGIQELVRITAPPPTVQYTGDNLSQTEVTSRLKALADTIDSRGWAIKGASYADATTAVASDRLLEGSVLPGINNADKDAGVDIFETATAKQIDNQINISGQQLKDRAVSNMKAEPTANDNLWFMGQPAAAPGQATFTAQVTAPAADNSGLSPLFSSAATAVDPADQQLLDSLDSKKAAGAHSFQNHKSINPYNPTTPPVTASVSPVTIELARNNDRNVDSLAREAGSEEVIVPLH